MQLGRRAIWGARSGGVLSAATFQRSSGLTCKPAGLDACSAPAAAQRELPRATDEAHGPAFVAGAPWKWTWS